MGKRRSNNSVTAARGSSTPQGVTASPPSKPSADAVAPPSSGSTLFILAGVGLIAVIGLIVVVWSKASSTDDRPDPTKEVSERDSQMCQKFLTLHNAGDPAAEELLGMVPFVPAEAISAEQAEAIETNYFLRDPGLRIISVRYKSEAKGVNHFVFRTAGNVAGPRFMVRTAAGIVTPQRTMSNPDLHVRVHGKIVGERATLQRD
jgi:hypothetical protein